MARFLDNFKPIVNRSPPLGEVERERRGVFRRRALATLAAAAVGGPIAFLIGFQDGLALAIAAPVVLAAGWAFGAALGWEHGPRADDAGRGRRALDVHDLLGVALSALLFVVAAIAIDDPWPLLGLCAITGLGVGSAMRRRRGDA